MTLSYILVDKTHGSAFWNDPETGRKRCRYLGKFFEPPKRRTPPRSGFGEFAPPPGQDVLDARRLLGVPPNASRAAAREAWLHARARRPRAALRLDTAWVTYITYRGWTT